MIKSVLPEIPIFENLDREQIEELSTWLHRKDISRGATIIHQDDSSDGLFVLAKGEVEVLKQNGSGELVIAELEAPSVIGEMGLLNAAKRSAAVRAKTDVVVGLLPAALFMEKLKEVNVTALLIGVNLGRIACQRLRVTTDRLAALSDACTRHADHGVEIS